MLGVNDPGGGAAGGIELRAADVPELVDDVTL
jgi:hypothetical protein